MPWWAFCATQILLRPLCFWDGSVISLVALSLEKSHSWVFLCCCYFCPVHFSLLWKWVFSRLSQGTNTWGSRLASLQHAKFSELLDAIFYHFPWKLRIFYFSYCPGSTSCSTDVLATTLELWSHGHCVKWWILGECFHVDKLSSPNWIFLFLVERSQNLVPFIFSQLFIYLFFQLSPPASSSLSSLVRPGISMNRK